MKRQTDKLNRTLRIFMLVGLVAIVGATVVSEFWPSYFRIYGLAVESDRYSLVSVYYPAKGSVSNDPFFSFGEYFETGSYIYWAAHERSALFALPWWLVLSFWSTLTIMVWRLTRRQNAGGAFPVELNKPSEPSR